MTTTITSPVSRRRGRTLSLAVVATLTYPAVGQPSGMQSFWCIERVQTFTVPDGVTSLTALLHGGHGSYPDEGAQGGFGGFVGGNLSVSPGQTLYVWVGCIEHDKLAWGYGNGGYKGTSGPSGDGGFGGGGSAVLLDPAGFVPLLVAGGGGGGGGNAGDYAPGGNGGNGGNPPEAGQNGGYGGRGGCGGCTSTPNGADGMSTSSSDGGGGGGGGGGGYRGGDGGEAGSDGLGGGGGGGGLSFADASATEVIFETSPMSTNGAVYLIWPAETALAADADRDRVPDALDHCPASDARPTIVIEACDSGAGNDLDVDGCTTADRITQLAADAKNRGRFISGVAQLTQQLQKQGLITNGAKQAIQRCVAQSG